MNVTVLRRTVLTPNEKVAIQQLWNNEYPVQLQGALEELEAYLAPLLNKLHLFAVDESDKIVAWAMMFDRDGERWFAIIVDRSTQGKGVGKLLLEQLQQNTDVLSGWVSDCDNYRIADGRAYRSPLPFYVKNGFNIVAGVRLETGNLSALKINWQKG